MKNKSINELCQELGITKYELKQGIYQKKLLTDKLLKAFEKKYRMKICLTAEDDFTQQEIITAEELEFQKERCRNNKKETRDYREVAIIFQVNRYYERVLAAFISNEYDLELYVNPKAYNNREHRNGEPDLIDLDGNCYDIQSRVLNAHNVVNCIQILESKINYNYKKYINKYKNYYVIYMVLKGIDQFVIQIVDINDCYKNNKFYMYASEQLKDQDNRYYRVRTEIKFDEFTLDDKKGIKKTVKEMDERERLHKLSYKEKRAYCKDVDIKIILNAFNILIDVDNMIKCPFHNDTNPSARVYEESNSIFCYGCNKRYDSFEVYSKLSGVTDFVQMMDNIIDISLNKYSSKGYKRSGAAITTSKKTIDKANEEYTRTKGFIRTLEQIKEDEKRVRETTNPGFKDWLYVNAHKYLKMREIDYEKCQKILNLNGYSIGWGYIGNENSFYCDYGMQDGKGYIIQRHINSWVDSKKHTQNKKYNIGNVDCKIIYTSNESKTRDYYKNKQVVITEGIMDALSLITMSDHIEDYVIVVLNSVDNLNKLFVKENDEYKFIDKLDKYINFTLCLDSDKAGEEATDKFIDRYIEITNDDDLEHLKVFDLELDDMTFNDLNDYWVYLKNTYLNNAA